MYEINLLPYNLKQKKQIVFKTRQYVAMLLLIAFILFLGVYIPKLQLESLKKQEAELKQVVTANSTVIEQAKSTNEELAAYKQKIDTINSITKDRVVSSDRIKEIQQYIPKEGVLQFDSFNYTKAGFVINGRANRYNAISEFVANLQMSKKYSSARITNITGSSTFSFSINITY